MEEEEKIKITESILYPFLFVALLWVIKLSEVFFEISFAKLGILPRTLQGLFGIATAPLVHGDIYHLGSNTLPLLILGIIILYFYRTTASVLFVWIYLVTGVLVWLTGDEGGYHIGASGLIYGLVSFLFFSGVIRKDRRSLALALLVTFVYGGMVWGIFPFFNGISWESHLYGGITGAFCAWYYRDLDPVLHERYDWEFEEESGDVSDEEQGSDSDELKYRIPQEQPIHYVYNVKTGDFEVQNQKEQPKETYYRYVYVKKKVELPDSDVKKGDSGKV